MKKILVIFLGIFVLISCKKEETVPSTLVLSNTTVAGNYKTTAATINPIGSTLVFDFFNIDTYYPPCQRDNLHTFTVAGMYAYADIGIFCTTPPAAPQTGPYTISNSDTTLTFSGKRYKVETLTSTNMIIAFDSAAVGRVRLTLTKQ